MSALCIHKFCILGFNNYGSEYVFRKFEKAKLECHALLTIYIVFPLYLQHCIYNYLHMVLVL